MKVLMINGSPDRKGCISTAFQEAAKILNAEGIETEEVVVGNKDIRGCIACRRCKETGKCVFNDLVNETAPKLAALSFMVFNLFVPPCMVAVAVTFREMGPKKWGWFAVAFQLFVGYVIALNAYRLGVFFAGGGFGFWTAVAILVDVFCLWMIFRPARKDVSDAGGARDVRCEEGK